MVRIWKVLKFYTSVSESASKLLVEGLICELLLGIGINNVRGTSPCSVNEEPRIMSGSLNFFFQPHMDHEYWAIKDYPWLTLSVSKCTF